MTQSATRHIPRVGGHVMGNVGSGDNLRRFLAFLGFLAGSPRLVLTYIKFSVESGVASLTYVNSWAYNVD